MKLSKLFIIIYILLCSQAMSQDVITSVTNYFKYGTGFENYGEGGFVGKKKKEYLDNFLDARIYFSDITMGFRLDVSNPPEFGMPKRGLSKKYLEFKKNGLNIRVGDLYTLFSRGLSLNLFEDRDLGYDTGLEGIKAEYFNKYFRTQIVGGEINFIEPLTLYDINPRSEKYIIRAGSLELIPINFVSIGGNFVWAEADLPTMLNPESFDKTIARIPEFFIKLRLSSIDLHTSYAMKQTRINNIDSSKGDGFYSSLSHTGKGYGIIFEYKNYKFDEVDPIGRVTLYRPTRMLPFQNPPIVHKEHSFTLLRRYPHLVDFNDEVGLQVEAFISISPKLTLNTNLAMASRHYAYEFDFQKFETIKHKKGNPNIPSLLDERSPFWEAYFELEYYFLDFNSYLKFGINRRSDINYEVLLKSVQSLRQTAIPLEILYTLDDEWSIKGTSESQWIYKYPHTKRFFNQLFAISISRSPNISFSVLYEFTTSDSEPQGKKNWYAVETSYKIGDNHTIILSYGDEKGGQVCSNGLCRQIYPFNGIRFSITSNL